LSRRTVRIVIVPVALSGLMLAGCYEKVISARGFGADHYDVAAPDSPSTGPVGKDWIKSTSQVQPHTTPGDPTVRRSGW
jgi:hypothetical protein